MSIEAIRAASAGGAGVQGAGGGGLDTAQFMNLLITQMQHQDPFSPMDNQAFMGQLAQFASLEQLQAVNQQLAEASVYSQSLNNTMLLDLVGRNATVPGDKVVLEDGKASTSQVLAGSGGTATIEVRDRAGHVVATYNRAVQAGWSDITWDGRLADGTAAASGDYTLKVTVTDRAGTALKAETYMTGVIDSIRFVNNVAVVRIAGEDRYVSEIAQISR